MINTRSALRLELSKIAQYTELESHGIRTPYTVAAVGRDKIVAAATRMKGPFITKHNRAGKGLGVKLFQNVDALIAHVDSPAFEDSVDGITLIQEYIRAPEPYITRVEFVGGRFLYAVRVDTSLGFELCPPPTSAKWATRSARSAKLRQFRHRHGSRSYATSPIRSWSVIAAFLPTTASVLPASNS